MSNLRAPTTVHLQWDEHEGRRIGAAGGIGGDFFANAFELSATDIFEILRSGVRRRLRRGRPESCSASRFLRHVPRDRDAIFDGDSLDRNEGNDIRGAHAGMSSLVLAKIDQLGGFAHPADGSFLDGVAVANDRDDAAIVVGIHFAIQEIDTSIFMASTMASTLALSRPSEKLGTHSTSVVGMGRG